MYTHRYMDTQTCMHTYTHAHTHAYTYTQATGTVHCPMAIWLCLAPSRALDIVSCLTEHRPFPPQCCPPSSVSHYLASSHTQLLPFPQVFFPDVLMLMQHLPCPLPTLWGTGQDSVAMRSGHDLFLVPQAPRSHGSSLLHPLGLEAP